MSLSEHLGDPRNGAFKDQAVEILRLAALGHGDRTIIKMLPSVSRYRVAQVLREARIEANAKAKAIAAADKITATTDKVTAVPLLAITAAPNSRPVREATVAILAESIDQVGLLEPVILRRIADGYEIIAGRHRIEAFRRLERESIPALIREADDLVAELMLIDENLCRNELSPAERAMAINRRKAIYLELHPTTAHGGNQGDGGRFAPCRQVGETAERFTKATATATGIAERTVQRDAARGEKLGTHALKKIAGTALDKGEELDALTKLSEAKRAELVERAASGETVTAKHVVKQERRAAREAELGDKIAAGNLALPAQRFGVILADPAWGRTVYSEATGMDRHAANHYPTATGDEATQDDAIKARPVASIAADNCVLGLWCTDPHRGVDTLRAWGFEFKSYFVWLKDMVPVDGTHDGREMLHTGDRFEVVGAAGTGYWRRDRCELLLIGIRGKPVCPAPGTQGESVWFARRGEHAASRDEKHSDKPECSFQWFEHHWPTTPKIELNARRARPGWSRWGLEAPPADTAEEEAA